MMVFMAISSAVTSLYVSLSFAWNRLAIFWFLAPCCGLLVVCVGRQFLLVRNRCVAGNVVSFFCLFAASAAVGFLGWNFAWLATGMALFFFTHSFLVAHHPVRMDYSLFLRPRTDC